MQDLRALISEAEGLLAGSLKEQSTETIESLRERLGAAQERLAQACGAAKRKVLAGAHYADDTIRENPYQAMAVAAGIGVLVGVLLGRSSSSNK